jgi:hypothetical protein
MKEFIAKKRDMFLIQMSLGMYSTLRNHIYMCVRVCMCVCVVYTCRLGMYITENMHVYASIYTPPHTHTHTDTKRQEIQKLEEKAQMKEDALKKSEMMLEEDAMRFDAFLKANDKKAHDALRKADAEAKVCMHCSQLSVHWCVQKEP